MSDKSKLDTSALSPDLLLQLKIMQESAAAAAAESRALGLPALHWRNEQLVYVMPDGTETTERPAILELTEAERRQL